MNHLTERRHLEHLLATEQELRDKRARGDIDNLDYLVRAQHIRRTFGENHPRPAYALALAEEVLHHWTNLTPEQRAAKERLSDTSCEEYGAWINEYKNKCAGPMALKLLEGLQGVEPPPVPEPSPKAIEAAKKAYSSRLGPTDDIGGAAKVPNFAAKEPARTMVGPGGGGGVGEPDDGASVGSGGGGGGGGGGPAYDSRIHHEPRRVADLVAGNSGIKFGPGAPPFVR